MPQGGRITLSTRTGDFPRAEVRSDLSRKSPGEARTKVNPGSARRAVSLAVQDNGCGMSAETRARLFEPFFTTKRPGEGTGLGLATVQRIVSESGGTIQVESEAGSGTCIEIFLPAVEASIMQPAIAQPAIDISANSAMGARPRTGEPAPDLIGRTILLVDDHAATRKSMQRFLLEAGCRILPAHGGKEAVKVFEEHSGAVDLLIADCMMPDMDGKALAETLLRRKPGLKVLLISGYEHTSVEVAGRFGAGAVQLVRKPFSGKALIQQVIEALRSP
jgi:two-component system, cell cycle sensor histidine kinase and response regulator CckA